MAQIWALLSRENNYDQPDNNLVAWWADKPSYATLADAIGCGFQDDAAILLVVRVAEGCGMHRYENCDYRLQLYAEGKL